MYSSVHSVEVFVVVVVGFICSGFLLCCCCWSHFFSFFFVKLLPPLLRARTLPDRSVLMEYLKFLFNLLFLTLLCGAIA